MPPIRVKDGKDVPAGFLDAAQRYFAGAITFRELAGALDAPLDSLSYAFLALDYGHARDKVDLRLQRAMDDWRREVALCDLSSGKAGMWHATLFSRLSEEDARHELDVRGLPQPEVAKARARKEFAREGIGQAIVDAVLGVAPDCLAVWLMGSRAFGYAEPDDNYNICVVVPDGRDTPELGDALYDAGMGPAFGGRDMRFTVLGKRCFTETISFDGINGRVVRDGVLLYAV
jgi:hypothetical protein